LDDHYEESLDFSQLFEGLPYFLPGKDVDFKDINWLEGAHFLGYLIEVSFVAVPWTIINALLVLKWIWSADQWSLKWSKEEAGSIFNAVFLLSQSTASILTAFELPYFVHRCRGFRMVAFLSALIYSIIFLGLATYSMYTHDELSLRDVLVNFSEIQGDFDLGKNWPVLMVNLFLVLKEASFFVLPGMIEGNYLSFEVSDISRALDLVLWFINPLTWLDYAWNALFHYDVEDVFVEKEEDESHYYSNILNKNFRESYLYERNERGDIVMTPNLEDGFEHEDTIIYVHGLGGKASNNIFLFKDEIFKNTKVVLPQAPKMALSVFKDLAAINSWFDILSFPGSLDESQINETFISTILNIDQVKESAEYILQLVERERLLVPGQSYDRIFLGGIS